jgi:hypothetical protein
MALYYNNNGTVSEVIINAIMDGKVTSSIATAPNVDDSVAAQKANTLISASVLTGTSINDAYTQAHLSVSSSNLNFRNQTYLSSTTPTPTAFHASSSNWWAENYIAPNGVVMGTSSSKVNFASNYTTPLMIPADTTLESIIDSRLLADVDLTGGTLSPSLKTINASKITTTYSNGTVLVVGDDTYIKDANLQNGFNIVGQQQQYRGFVRFGTGSNAPLIGHNGNNVTLPAPGDNTYAFTGSMIVSASKLMFYNGSSTGTNGWTAII